MEILRQYLKMVVVLEAFEKCKSTKITNLNPFQTSMLSEDLKRIFNLEKMKTITFLVCLLTFGISFGQVDQKSEVFQKLKATDSILFNVGFNTCKMEPFEMLVSENFEFYHDKGGITNSKAKFIQAFKEGLCKSPSTYQSRRELVKGSLEVFELKKNGEIYGAIQMGKHRFFEKSIDKPETAGNIARFTHLWLLENNEWKLARALSFDHLDP